MIVDNFDKIAEILPESENPRDSMFLILIVVRHKDGHTDIAKGNNRNRTIRSYQINSVEELLSKKQEIVDLCTYFKARAYININPKNTIDVLLKLLDMTREGLRCMWNGDTRLNLRGLMDGAIAKTGVEETDVVDDCINSVISHKENRTWVVDCDDLSQVDEIRDAIINARGVENPIVAEIPTHSGLHFITKTFDWITAFDKFENKSDLEPKKNSYTLLFYDDGNS